MSIPSYDFVGLFESIGIRGMPIRVGQEDRLVILITREQLWVEPFKAHIEVRDFLVRAASSSLYEVRPDTEKVLLKAVELQPKRSLFHLGSVPRTDGSGGLLTRAISRGTFVQAFDFRWPPEPEIMAMFCEDRWLFEYRP